MKHVNLFAFLQDTVYHVMHVRLVAVEQVPEMTRVHQIEAPVAVNDRLAGALHGAKTFRDHLERQDLALRHSGVIAAR